MTDIAPSSESMESLSLPPTLATGGFTIFAGLISCPPNTSVDDCTSCGEFQSLKASGKLKEVGLLLKM